MGRCVPPRGNVLLSPSRSAGTPRDGSRTARCGGATPRCVVVEKRKAMGRGACCAKRRDTTRFRAVFWVSPHPCLPAYTLMYGPNHSPKGLFRLLKWADYTLPRARELLRAGVGILGQGHTPHSGSALA